MKNYFFGIFPDEQSKNQIARIIGSLSLVFKSQGTSINWAKPEQYHISLLFIGKNISFVNKALINLALKKFESRTFKVKFGKAKLGISNKYRELVNLSVEEGGEDMRNMVFDLSTKLHIKRDQAFLPNLTLGRVTKDISDEEYKNLLLDVNKYNNDNDFSISFDVSKMYFIESNLSEYKVLKEVILS